MIIVMMRILHGSHGRYSLCIGSKGTKDVVKRGPQTFSAPTYNVYQRSSVALVPQPGTQREKDHGCESGVCVCEQL